MKSFLVIGVGAFGRHLVQYLSRHNCEILVADKDEKKLQGLLQCATSAKIADCTDPDVLTSFDVPGFDACFVCVDSDFLAQLEIICLLKDLGAKKVYGCADHDLQARLLERNGADVVIYPEKDMARRIALNVSSENIFDSYKLAKDFYVCEIAVRPEWIGKTLKELDFRARYSLNVLARKENGAVLDQLPDDVFEKDVHILVMGKEDAIRKVTS